MEVQLFQPIILLATVLLPLHGAGTSVLKTDSLATNYFGNDKSWYAGNIPFFECSNKSIQDVYYYRWALYKSHLRDNGASGFIVTEFLNAMSWDIKPYNSIQDAAGHHIYEGRWLRNQRYLNDYIHFQLNTGFQVGAYSENIADAAWNRYLVNMDAAFVKKEQSAMRSVYGQWVSTKYDKSKGLYHITPLSDATEYTIASIDATGGADGFTGGEAFRPSINSYQFGNARAISNIARLSGDSANRKLYSARADSLKTNLQTSLWNTTLQHFIDRYQVTNSFVTYWNYIRGRELVGYVPWAFSIPDDNPTYNASWRHLMDTAKFFGRNGPRTVEPSYQYYMRQYRYAGSKPECQWNGPSWPYQETFVLMGMANLLSDYSQTYVSRDDYMKVLKKYTYQHYYTDRSFNLLEDYYPDTAAPAPLVDLTERSQHYNHSQYDNLIISGLCGIRPSEGNVLTVNPMAPEYSASDTNALSYFALENVPYHGHDVTVLYDATGSRYGQGKGLSIFVDGVRQVSGAAIGKQTVDVGAPVVAPVSSPTNLAVNMSGKGTPTPSASFTNGTGNVWSAIDGRIWYWTNTVNRWSCQGSNNAQDWYQVDLGSTKTFTTVKLSFFENGSLKAPSDYKIQVSANGSTWTDAPNQVKQFNTPLGNTTNIATFSSQASRYVRALFTNKGNGSYTALTEMEVTNEDPATVGLKPSSAPEPNAHSARWHGGALEVEGGGSASVQLLDAQGGSVVVRLREGKASIPLLRNGMYHARFLDGTSGAIQGFLVLR